MAISPLPKIKTKAPEPTEAQDTRARLVEAQKQQNVANLKSAFESTKRQLGAEAEALTPRFREARADVETQDTMAREEMRKGLATLGLSGAGAAPQSETAQSVITQGARSGLAAQEQELRADIERRLTEAKAIRDQGIAGAQSEANILMLQDRLNQLDKADTDRKIAEEQAKSDYLSTITRFSGDYQAEINRVKNDGDPSNDWQIPYLETARMQKIQEGNLDPQTGQPLGAQYTVSQALEATRQGFWNEAIASALGLPFTEQARVQATGGGFGMATQAPQVRPDTGLAGNITGYQDMMALLSAGRATGIDPVTKQPTYEQTTPTDKIRQIQNDYEGFVRRFGEGVVEAIVNELAIEAGIIADPNAQEPIEAETPVELTQAEQYVESYPYATARAELINLANLTEARTALDRMEDNAELLIAAYGDADYNKLIKTVKDKIEEFGG